MAGCSLTQGEVTGEADFITATDGKKRTQVAVGQAITFESYPPVDPISHRGPIS